MTVAVVAALQERAAEQAIGAVVLIVVVAAGGLAVGEVACRVVGKRFGEGAGSPDEAACWVVLETGMSEGAVVGFEQGVVCIVAQADVCQGRFIRMGQMNGGGQAEGGILDAGGDAVGRPHGL